MSITEIISRLRRTNIGDEFSPPSYQSHSSRVKVFKKLSDSDPVPACKYFGRFQGVRLGDVPAAQLDRWRDARWIVDLYPNVRDYIDQNEVAIDRELSESGLI